MSTNIVIYDYIDLALAIIRAIDRVGAHGLDLGALLALFEKLLEFAEVPDSEVVWETVAHVEAALDAGDDHLARCLIDELEAFLRQL